jgi:hypothetical protein
MRVESIPLRPKVLEGRADKEPEGPGPAGRHTGRGFLLAFAGHSALLYFMSSRLDYRGRCLAVLISARAGRR